MTEEFQHLRPDEKLLIESYKRFRVGLARRRYSSGPQVERYILKQVEDALLAYANVNDDVRFPFPPPMAEYLWELVSELLAGGTPETLQAIARGGAPSLSAVRWNYILAAVCYIKACKKGLIEDKSPNKTVRQYFGVSASTVRDWCQDKRNDLDPESLPIPESCDLVEFLRKEMEAAGANYRQSPRTRTKQAIARRNKKRQTTPAS